MSDDLITQAVIWLCRKDPEHAGRRLRKAEDAEMRLSRELKQAEAERDALKEQNAKLREALSRAKDALKHVPENAFGHHDELGYPYRDELLHNIEQALSHPTKEA